MLNVLALLLAAQPSIAVPEATCARLEKSVCDSMVERFVAQLSAEHVKVISARDISLLLGLERQKQLLACNDAGTTCLAELSGALGVDGMISISITRSDPYFVATVRALKVRDGSTWASDTIRVAREGELFDAFDRTAVRFARVFDAGVSAQPGASSGPPRFLTLVPGLLGLAAAGAGVGTFLSAGSERQQLIDHQVSGMAAGLVADSGRTKESLGVGLMIGGGVAVVGSLIWFFASAPGPAVAVVPTRDGAVLSVSWVTP
ncbi:MAG: hypothetical protein U0228_16865 [Myxococcaceae bacterium]